MLNTCFDAARHMMHAASQLRGHVEKPGGVPLRTPRGATASSAQQPRAATAQGSLRRHVDGPSRVCQHARPTHRDARLEALAGCLLHNACTRTRTRTRPCGGPRPSTRSPVDDLPRRAGWRRRAHSTSREGREGAVALTPPCRGPCPSTCPPRGTHGQRRRPSERRSCRYPP